LRLLIDSCSNRNWESTDLACPLGGEALGKHGCCSCCLQTWTKWSPTNIILHVSGLNCYTSICIT
jgi:hypothetical protein